MIEYDEKGKFFTNIVSKKPIHVIIQTIHDRIDGEIHVRPNDRFKDALETDERFLAVTNAQIIDPAGRVALKAKFLSVRLSQIIWITPQEELVEDSAE